MWCQNVKYLCLGGKAGKNAARLAICVMDGNVAIFVSNGEQLAARGSLRTCGVANLRRRPERKLERREVHAPR